MVRKFWVSLLATATIALGALGLSSATATADCYDNGGYWTCTDGNPSYVQNDQDRYGRIWVDGPPGFAPVFVDYNMGRASWYYVQDEWGNFGHYELRDTGRHRGPHDQVIYERTQDYDYNLPPDAFTINGRFWGILSR